jgi:hypothetical protein
MLAFSSTLPYARCRHGTNCHVTGCSTRPHRIGQLQFRWVKTPKHGLRRSHEMPRIVTQRDFQKWHKPDFCYLCGKTLDDGTDLNDDHCPPSALFLPADRANYSIVLKVHERCNHSWHAIDEILATIYGIMHGSIEQLGGRRREPTIEQVENDQGLFAAALDVPLHEFAFRVTRCAHALLYGEWISADTQNSIHVPLPEVDRDNANRPKKPLPQFVVFANALCSAQKTNTYDALIANNRTKASRSASFASTYISCTSSDFL